MCECIVRLSHSPHPGTEAPLDEQEEASAVQSLNFSLQGECLSCEFPMRHFEGEGANQHIAGRRTTSTCSVYSPSTATTST